MIFIAVFDYKTNRKIFINLEQIVSIEETTIIDTCIIKTGIGEFTIGISPETVLNSSSTIELIELRKLE